MAGKYDKGALVHFMEAFLLPAPNIIDFQLNPETITHTWKPATVTPADWKDGGTKTHNALATTTYPGETLGFTIYLDAAEPAAAGNDPGLAKAAGVYPRLAALEMLQYPVSERGVGRAAASGRSRPLFRATQGIFGKTSFPLALPLGGGFVNVPFPIPKMQLPTVLFVWGPGRILPVRVSKLVITEKLYDTNLVPIQAEAAIELEVLTPEQLASVNGPLRAVARSAYVWSQWQRQALAVANEANTFQWIAGMFS